MRQRLPSIGTLATYPVRRFGVLSALMWAWLLTVLLWQTVGGHAEAAGQAAAIAALTPIVVHFVLSSGSGYSPISLEGLVVTVTMFYAVAVHGSVMMFGILDVPSGSSLSKEGLLSAALSVFVYLTSASIGMRLIASKVTRSTQALTGIESLIGRGFILFAVGSVGLALSFPNLGSLINYWGGDQDAALGREGVIGFLSTATRSFIPIGLALMLTPWSRRGPARAAIAVVFTAIAGALVLSTFSFNRAALIFPAIAALLTMANQGVKLRRGLLFFGFVLMAALFLGVGAYRESMMNPQFPTLALDQWIGRTLQVYGQVNNNLAVPYDNPEAFSIGSLLSGFLAPLPALGAEFRAGSGTAIYNRLLYGSGVVDQIVPLWAEAWAIGGVTFVGICGMVAGVLSKLLARAAIGRENLLLAFAWNWAVVWAAFSVFYSSSNLTQAFIYMILPVVLAGRLVGGSLPLRRSSVGTRPAL